MATRAKFARTRPLLVQICWGESHFSQKWPLANVGESGEYSVNGLANVGESGESCIIPKMAILVSTRTRQKRRIFGEYSNLLNLLVSGHCLIYSHRGKSSGFHFRNLWVIWRQFDLYTSHIKITFLGLIRFTTFSGSTSSSRSRQTRLERRMTSETRPELRFPFFK